MSRQAGAPITRRKALGIGALACGAVCMGVGLSSVIREAACARSYGDLAQATRLDFAAGATPVPIASASDAHADIARQGERDWGALREVNSAIAAYSRHVQRGQPRLVSYARPVGARVLQRHALSRQALRRRKCAARLRVRPPHDKHLGHVLPASGGIPPGEV